MLARLESAYSLIWGSHEIWGKGGGEPTNQDPARDNLAGKSCRIILRENLWENLAGNAVGNLVGNLVEKVLMVCNGSKNGKKPPT